MEVYLDNSATTRPSDAVVAAMSAAMTQIWHNPSALYRPAMAAEKLVAAARKDCLNAAGAAGHRLIFTSGGTEADNLAIFGHLRRQKKPGLVLILSVEHPAVLACAAEIERLGHQVALLPVESDGVLSLTALEEQLDERVNLICVMQVNNESGAVQPLEEVVRLRNAKAPGAAIHVDGVQGFLRVPIDLKYVDLYTLSSHKIHGPKGEGALVYRKGLRFAPRQIGGGQENGLRSGTENTPGIAGLMAAVQEMLNMGPQMQNELMQKKLHLIEAFQNAVPELLINGPEPEQAAPHIVNLSFPGVRGEVMLHALESKGVYASTGSACSSKKLKVSGVLTAMGISPSRAEWALRFSLSPHTTIEEIDYAAQCLAEFYAQLKKYARR